MNFANYPELTDTELNDAIHYAVEQVRSGLNDFTRIELIGESVRKMAAYRGK